MLFRVGNNRFFAAIRNLVLYFLIIFFLVFSAVPIKFFAKLTIFPNIASMLIFYFLIIKQESIAYFSIFVFGLLFDVFNGLPLGITSLTWLVTSKLISFLRMHLYTPDNFVATFRDFVIYAILNALMQWIIFSLLYRTAFPFSNTMVQIVLNIVFFAILYRVFKRVEVWFV